MAKLQSSPLYPITLNKRGIPVNLYKNKKPDGAFQIARAVRPGDSQETDFEVLFEGDECEADEFADQQVEKDYPGL
ncbi:MAG: hypothetical protein ACYCSN_11830 [Acidobacteriaceae bacterium]